MSTPMLRVLTSSQIRFEHVGVRGFDVDIDNPTVNTNMKIFD